MLIGEPPPYWRSLQRAYEVYQRGHEQAFQPSPPILIAGDGRTLLSDAGIRVYFRVQPADIDHLSSGPPALVALHGSCVLDRALVYKIVSSLRECDGVIVTCSSDAEIIRSFGHDPSPAIITLPLGTDISPKAANSGAFLRAVLNLTDDTKIISCVVRLIPHKNPHVFLEILNKLRLTHKVVGLLCGDYWDDYPSGIGGAAYRAYMQRLFEELHLDGSLLRFRGDMSDDDLSVVLAGSDLLIHPSLAVDENYGYTPVEAIACGTASVVTDYGGMKDNIINGVTGYRVRTWTTETGARTDTATLLRHADRLLSTDDEIGRIAVGCQSARAAFQTRHAVSVLSAAIRDSISSFASGQMRHCVAPPLTGDSGSTRWTIAGYEKNWPQIAPSVARYVSSPGSVDISKFAAVRRFGQQEITRRRLTVREPSVCFSGPVTLDEVALLEQMQNHLVPTSALDLDRLLVADNLLRAGVLTGTFREA